jgi:hypothetical protein
MTIQKDQRALHEQNPAHHRDLLCARTLWVENRLDTVARGEWQESEQR